MENIIRQLHPAEYAEKLRSRKILYEQENLSESTDDTLRENIPTINILNIKVYPSQVINIILNDSPHLSTIHYCAGSDRIMVINPDSNLNNDRVSFLVEILNLNRHEQQLQNIDQPNQTDSNQFILTVKGIRRFKIIHNTIRNVIENHVFSN
jgi:hypothetical protein